MSPRTFINSPMLYNGAAAAAYLRSVEWLSWAGRIADDGTIRIMVELDTSKSNS